MSELHPRPLIVTDAFSFSRFIKKSNLKGVIQDIVDSGSIKAAVTDATDEDGQVDQLAVGIQMFMVTFEAIGDPKVESAFYEFVAPLLGVKPSEVYNCDLIEMIEGLLQVADVDRWKVFFKAAGKTFLRNASTSSSNVIPLQSLS